jgi:hypothetical protein
MRALQERFLYTEPDVDTCPIHRFNDLVKTYFVLAIFANRNPAGIDRSYGTHSIAFDARNLHESPIPAMLNLHFRLSRSDDLIGQAQLWSYFSEQRGELASAMAMTAIHIAMHK